jgi:hypothetical protein
VVGHTLADHPLQGRFHVMTNPIAVFLVLLILTGLGLDLVFNSGDATLVIVRKFFDLIEWVAFWR